ncbi:MAG: hypothetical protein Q4F67_14600 [Propionibacteriaceae bacterium]|nr:hypothetical protein [Propionibacteriaceae bacterium]
MSTRVQRRDLARDARNRALRTLIQSLAADVGIAVLIAVSTWWSAGPDLSTRAAWVGAAVLVVKTAVTTALSYLMRRYVDGSSVPTPLPPDPVPPPSESHGDTKTAATWHPLTEDEIRRGVPAEPWTPNRPTHRED